MAQRPSNPGPYPDAEFSAYPQQQARHELGDWGQSQPGQQSAWSPPTRQYGGQSGEGGGQRGGGQWGGGPSGGADEHRTGSAEGRFQSASFHPQGGQRSGFEPTGPYGGFGGAGGSQGSVYGWEPGQDHDGSRQRREHQAWQQRQGAWGRHGGVMTGPQGPYGDYGEVQGHHGGYWYGGGQGDSGHDHGGRQGPAGSGQEHFDPDYHQWREAQMKRFDDDYRQWRQERYRRFSEEFSQWRQSRDASSAAADTGASSARGGAEPRGPSTSRGDGGAASQTGAQPGLPVSAQGKAK